MKYFSILEPPSKEAVRAFAEKRNLIDYLPEVYQHPQEDFLIASDTPPVFVVSDGVTLNFIKLIENNIANYPNPSPAGDVSRIFCEAVVKDVKRKYKIFNKGDVADVFKYANKEVRDYNEKVGKSSVSGNSTGYYSATGSFAIIKDSKAYWASICDSFIAHFDREMNLKFMSSGLCEPYAVINGEERMANYLESGILDLKKDDRIFIFTDGFEYYVKKPNFLALFKEWDKGLKKRIAEFSKEMNQEDPEKYGHERSLIAVLF
ncbi:MAG: protein phosphatase 2C domain-containing protein [Candidatus Azambacteria bacterium]|nr:protein phosphatase 2C domain-containing protein [Candidatus Azambacteria bacterium]